MTKEWLTKKQVSELTKFSVRKVEQWISDGLLPAAKFGDSQQADVRISAGDFEEFMRSHMISGK